MNSQPTLSSSYKYKYDPHYIDKLYDDLYMSTKVKPTNKSTISCPTLNKIQDTTIKTHIQKVIESHGFDNVDDYLDYYFDLYYENDYDNVLEDTLIFDYDSFENENEYDNEYDN